MTSKVLDKLISYRFEMLLAGEIAILFGALVMPREIFDQIFSGLFFYLNLIAGGVLLISKKRYHHWFVAFFLILTGLIYGSALFELFDGKSNSYFQMAITFVFYILVTFEIVMQVWSAKIINKTVIFGLICGYITLGFIGFFICMSIEMAFPGSFEGLYNVNDPSNTLTERLMYYSYITMLTIGYGEIIPITSLAQKASILIGLLGQFYLAIITASIVGKYINQTSRSQQDEG